MLVQAAPTGWDAVLNFLEAQDPFIELLIVVAWGLFIYYTIKTFRQIKRQADLQSEAFLVIGAEATSSDSSADNRIPEEATDLHSRWREILNGADLSEALGREDKYLVLRLHNRGKSDIVKWKLTITAEVEPGSHLSDNYKTSGEVQEWTIEGDSYEDILEENEDTSIGAALLGPFPVARFRWEVSYKDMRDVTYSRFGGDATFTDRNVFADPTSEGSNGNG